MRLIKRIKWWFENLLNKKKKKHFFEESVKQGYLPCLPMGDDDRRLYKSKIARDSETLVGGRFKSGNKKRHKA